MKVGEADLSYLQIWDNEGYRTDICCRGFSGSRGVRTEDVIAILKIE